MRKNKGFTLTELLAVIVILGILGGVATTAALKIRKKTSIKEIKDIARTIKDLGPGIYSYEMYEEDSEFMEMYESDEKFKITLNTLKEAGYLKNLVKDENEWKIKNPLGNGNDCTGYLLVDPANEDYAFSSYVSCPNLLDEYIPDNEKSDSKKIIFKDYKETFEGDLTTEYLEEPDKITSTTK